MERSGLYDNIKCPYCGASHYTLGTTIVSCVYYPPVVQDGRMIVNDHNYSRTECNCLECGRVFHIVSGNKVEEAQGSKL